MTLAITYLGIINIVSFGCLGIVCFVLLALNCHIRLERDTLKEDVEEYKHKCETYEAMIDKKNEAIADLMRSDSEHARVDAMETGEVEVFAQTVYGGRPRIIRIYHYSTEDERILALNLAEELADKINEQI